MTQRELEDKVWVCRASNYNCYHVQIAYRGEKYGCYSHNSLAWDSLHEADPTNPMTVKQALQQFYNECKRENNLK